jgi:DNA adenine methylase
LILRRLGNKTKIAKEIQKYFPTHSIYVEPFFGAGGMFFNKPKVKFNIVNDMDSDVFNLFQVVSNNYQELETAFYQMPIHSELLKHWKETPPTTQIERALFLLLHSNFTFNGYGATIVYGGSKSVVVSQKNAFGEKIALTNKMLFDVQFANFDFRKFLKALMLSDKDVENALIYCDPPYLGTDDNYKDGFLENDSNDLFDSLQETGCKWAMSEFNHPFIIEQAKQRNLNVITIGERQNLKNRRTEILVTNYKKDATLFDF